MDLTTVLLAGFAAGLAGVAGASAIVILAKNRLKSVVLSAVDDYVGSFLQNLQDNPKDMAERFRPLSKLLVAQALQGLGSNEGGAEPMIKLPLIGKVPVSFLTQFLGGQAKQAATNAVKDTVSELVP